jgi:hypothetical protein
MIYLYDHQIVDFLKVKGRGNFFSQESYQTIATTIG